MASPHIDIVVNSALVASIIPLGNEAGLYAMKSFGTFPMPTAVLLAILGATLGLLFNFHVGKLLAHLTSKGKKPIPSEKYQRLQGYFHKYGVFTLLFCWLPMGNFLPVAAGFFKTPPKIALPLMIAGMAAHYGWALLY